MGFLCLDEFFPLDRFWLKLLCKFPPSLKKLSFQMQSITRMIRFFANSDFFFKKSNIVHRTNTVKIQLIVVFLQTYFDEKSTVRILCLPKSCHLKCS